jgi:hypothetical protein
LTSTIKALDDHWQTIISVGGILTTTRNLHVWITYLVVGLITTAIVAGLSPGSTIIVIPYSPNITYGPNIGTYRVDNANVAFSDPRPYSWNLGNNSVFFYLANANGPTRSAIQLASSINSINPDVYAYADEGVAVTASAVGTPIYIYSPQENVNPEMTKLLGIHGSNAVNTSQCVPVMRCSPISCHVGGSVVAGSEYNLTVISDDYLCSVEVYFLGLDPRTDNTMGKGMCAHGAIGQGTIVFGATYGYITWAETCSDTTDVFEYRAVTLSFQNVNISGPTYSRLLSGRRDLHARSINFRR